MENSSWLMAYVDGYCERLMPGLLAEPFNAITNVAFMVAAFVLWRVLMRAEGAAGARDISARFLIIVLWCIGFGSLAFHTFAMRWAGIADSLPIAVFIFTYIYLALRRYYGAPIWGAVLGPPILLGLSFVLGWLGLGALAGYAPAFIAMLVLGVGLWRRAPRIAYGLVSAGLVFGVSLTLRTVDMPLCSVNPLGTHWAWHMLNGLTLYLVTRLYIENVRMKY